MCYIYTKESVNAGAKFAWFSYFNWPKKPFTSKWVYHYQLPTGKTYYYNSNKSQKFVPEEEKKLLIGIT